MSENSEPKCLGVALLIVGDELLSGKRPDKHLPKVIELLNARGIELLWASFVGDDETLIAERMQAARAQNLALLCCGGIGATPDDRTRQAAARAYDLPIELHAEAAAILREQFGEQAHAHRLRMAEFPQGAALIPNPVNRVAGFSIGHCYCVPGFPEMAWPMLEWVLDGPLAALANAEPPVEYRLRALGTSGESDLVEIMEALLAEHPEVKLSSLPFRGSAERPRHIEFGIRGPRAAAQAAFQAFVTALSARAELRIELIAAP